ncbi:Uncharacterised protein [Bordetella ansorpii]|uniref:Lipoprotein n=1 Tax=Bordetella ansorpii TaxID=288768 RepID=A0A157QZ79_9BORD|nr:hypothetical protein [Bordetella ansorpii]SAI50874.1 Uncharacterised protein [Bordetella ansorpii]
MDYKVGRRTLPALLSIAILSLAACGGGGGDDDDQSSANPPSTSVPSTPTAATRLTGTAATGAALANVSITLTDVNFKTLTGRTNDDGSFVFDISGVQAPFVLVAADPSGRSVPMVSLLTEVPAVTGPNPTAVVNLTPLTTAVAALLVESGDPIALTRDPALLNVSPGTLQGAISALKAVLADILSANGVPADFDPFNTPFTADHSGVDAVIDALSLQNTPNGLRIASIGDPSAGRVLSQKALSANGSLGEKLPTPSVAANYLAALPVALQSCLADGSIGANEAACGTALSSSYRFNGLASFLDAHIEAAAGVTAVGMPKTLTLLNEGKRALVQIPYTLANGTTGTWTEFVVNTPNGGWQIHGNQQIYEVRLRSFLMRSQTLSAPGQFILEAGVQIGIPYGGMIDGQEVTFASVSGPGIAGKAWLAPRTANGASSLALVMDSIDELPNPIQLRVFDTALYRWSWMPFFEDGAYTAPRLPGIYNRVSRVYDAATIPPYSAYTVTFFNIEGVKIGENQVINPALPMTADVGRTLNAWRELTDETVASVLTPSGSQAGDVPSVKLSWTETSINGVNVTPPLATTQVKSTDQMTGAMVHGNRLRGDMPTVANDVYSLSVTAGVPQNGTVSICDPACSFLALNPGTSRSVELSGLLNEASIYDIFSFYTPFPSAP